MSFNRTKIVKTHKDHQCFGCGDIIPAGTECTYFACKVVEDFSYGYNCKECEAIMKCQYFKDCFEYGEFYEFDLAECKTCEDKDDTKE